MFTKCEPFIRVSVNADAALDMETLMRDPLDDLLERALAASRERQWRRENPYVVDLVEVLWPHGPGGLSRRKVIESMKVKRHVKGLPVPDSFEETVQSAFNQHCIDSAVFRKRGVPTDGLFSSRRSGNSTSWLVHRDRAAAWLIARNEDAERV